MVTSDCGIKNSPCRRVQDVTTRAVLEGQSHKKKHADDNDRKNDAAHRRTSVSQHCFSISTD